MGKTIKKIHPKIKKKKFDAKKKNPQITEYKSKYKTYPGYCSNKGHKGYMTIEAICKHKCLEEECPFFKAELKHRFWADEDYKNDSLSFKQLSKLKAYAKVYRENNPDEIVKTIELQIALMV